MRQQSDFPRDRHTRSLDPYYLDLMTLECAAWHESPEEVVAALERGRIREARLAWVRQHMAQHLTPRERECVELCCFQGLTGRGAARLTQTNPSSICRALQRAGLKLRRVWEREREQRD